ncbi:hypothetical protein, partial [Staphylococcus aureus]
LSYPPDASIDFLSRFKTIIDQQKKGTQEIVSKPATTTAASNTAPSVSQPQPSNSPSSSASTVSSTGEQKTVVTVDASKEAPKVSFGS